MFEKLKLTKELKEVKKQIAEVEVKRYRSQAALVEAILKSTTPDDADVDYFNKYTIEIDALREKIHNIQRELEKFN